MSDGGKTIFPEKGENFEEALDVVLSHLVKRADEERRKSEPWKQLFKSSEKGLQSLLSDADEQTISIILALGDVIKERFEIKHLSNRLWDLLRALPFAMSELRDGIQESQGLSCCADKARKIYYEAVLEEINKIKKEQDER